MPLRGLKRKRTTLSQSQPNAILVTSTQASISRSQSTQQSTLPWALPSSTFTPQNPAQPSQLTPAESVEVEDDEEELQEDATVDARRRIRFEIDHSKLDGQYRPRYRNKRTINNRISWVFLHGMELEKLQGGRWLGTILALQAVS